MLEAARDNGGFNTVQAISNLSTNPPTSSKNKAKGVFTMFDHSDPESEDEVSTSAHVVAGHSIGLNRDLITSSLALSRITIMRKLRARNFLQSLQRIAGLRSLEGAFVILV